MRKVLVIAPHPDDETIGCGGTILSHKFKGDKVYQLIMTRMTQKHGWSNKKIIERKKEIKKVSKLYKFSNIYQLNFPACTLDTIPLENLIKSTFQIIKKINPEIIYMPYHLDVHTDHQITAKVIQACIKWFRAPSIKKVLMYETISETDFNFLSLDNFKPNTFVNISNFIKTKNKILSIYKSEIGKHPFPRSIEAIESLAILRGIQSGYKFAEGFHLVFQR